MACWCGCPASMPAPNGPLRRRASSLPTSCRPCRQRIVRGWVDERQPGPTAGVRPPGLPGGPAMTSRIHLGLLASPAARHVMPQSSAKGVVAVIALTCAWVVLCFASLVLLIPVVSVEGLFIRVALVMAPVLLLWVFYFAGRASPAAMTALLIAILVVSGLSIRSRALSDTSLDPQNMVKLAIWGSGLLVALLNWRHLRAALHEPAVRWLVAMSVWAAFTAVYSPIRAYSFGSGIAFLSVLLFGVCLRRVVPDRLLLKGSIGALTPLLYVSLVMYVVAPQRAMALMEAGNILRLAAPFASPNSLGLVAAIVILLCAVGWQTGVFKWRSPWVLAAVPAALACMYLSQSRTAGVALVAALQIGR